jgi:hypothetical protein
MAGQAAAARQETLVLSAQAGQAFRAKVTLAGQAIMTAMVALVQAAVAGLVA